MGSSSLFQTRRIGPMMDTRVRSFLLLLLPLTAGSGFSGKSVEGVFLKIGTDGGTYISALREIAGEESVYVQYRDPSKKIRCCKVIHSKSLKKQETDTSVMDAAAGKTVFTYQVADEPRKNAPDVLMGLVGTNLSPKGVGEKIEVQGGGRRVVAQSCTGAEGVNLVVKDHGRVVSHLYLSVGYDLQHRTCRQSDLQSTK